MTKQMTRGVFFAVSLAVSFATALVGSAPTAKAHFRLINPPSSTAQNAQGDPQKSGPCPTGTATNMITKVKAGDTVKVQFEETVSHGGHFRFSIGNPAEMKDPMVMGKNCAAAAIENPPKLPTLLDGALVHNQGGRKMWEQEVKIPDNMSCEKCTLQVLQFMNMHGEPCFYYHCADLQITASAGTPDAGAATDAASGSGGSSGSGGATGSGGTSGSGGSAGSASGGSAGSASGGSPGGSGGSSGSSTGGSAGSSTGGSSGSRGGSSGSNTGGSSSTSDGGGSSGGCAVGGPAGGASGFGVLALVGMMLIARRRRR